MNEILKDMVEHFERNDYSGDSTYEFYITIDGQPYNIIIKESDFYNYSESKYELELQLLHIMVYKYPEVLEHLSNYIDEFVDFNDAFDRGWVD